MNDGPTTTKLQLVTSELDKRGAFDSGPNETAKQMTELLGEDIPFEMSLGIANYSLATFVGHFHYKLDLGGDNRVPMNYIVFILAKSGAKKTSSMIKLEKSFKLGFQEIDKYRMQKEQILAEEMGVEPRRLNPLSNALATEAGMIKRLNEFKYEGIGCPAMYVDEISTELASNPDMVPNIKLVAQLFDDGDCKSKPLKDSKQQSEEVQGMGMCALFIGSEHGILEDPVVLTRFETEFISKLARRCDFIYPIFKDEEEEVTTIEALLADEVANVDNGRTINKILNKKSKDVADKAISNDFNYLKLSDDCNTLWTIYRLYCEEVSKLQDDVEAVALEQQHRHWKTLKLSGVYAVMNGHDKVEVQDFKEAIYATELTGKDIGTFIEKANRQNYEIMLEHFEHGGSNLSSHDMVKKRWINKPSDVKNLIELANAKCGTEGMIELDEDGLVQYTSFTVAEGLGVSYMMTENLQDLLNQGFARDVAKNKIAMKATTGFEYKRTTFEKIGTLMQNDTAYCPFNFRGGVRGKDYITGGADFVVLDIDDTHISDVECADMLADFNYIIARGSDADNPYKYRILIPFDVTIEVANNKWKPFLIKIGDYIGIDVDAHAMAQIYFGYKGRRLLINNDGIDLEASDLIKNIDEIVKKQKPLGKNQLGEAWNQRMHTFSNAYNAKNGRLHKPVWYATVQAHDMGFTLEQGLALLDDIIDYIDDEVREGYVDTLKKQMISNVDKYQHWVAEARALK